MEQVSKAKVGFNIFRSLGARLVFLFLLLSIAPVLAVGGLAYYTSEQALGTTTQQALHLLVQAQAHTIGSWLQQRQREIKAVAADQEISSMDPAQAAEAIRLFAANLELYENLFVLGPDGKTIASDNGELPDLADRDYIKKALQGQANISDAMISRFTGHVIIAVAAPIMRDGQVIGVAAGAVSTAEIAQVLTDLRLGQTGEAYLVNRDGYAITPSRFLEDLKQRGLVKERAELELQVDTFGAQQALAGQSGVGEYPDYRGVPVLGAYEPVEQMGWGLLVEQDTAEALAAATHLRNIILLVVLVVAGVVGTAALFVARGLARPILAIAGAARQLASGDVNQQIEVKSRDEIGDMADAFRAMIAYQQQMAAAANHLAQGDLTITVRPLSAQDTLGQAFSRMIASLRALVGQVIDNANGVSAAANQLASSADQAGQATQQIAAASQEQAAAINQTAHITEQMTVVIDQVAANAQTGAAAAAQASHTAQAGAAVIEANVKGIQGIRDKVALSAHKVKEMGQRSQQIGAIVETIDDIASQTNLLALNAAIEAARAGEQGRGFAVVADEVRKLAEKSAVATREIAGLIHTIQQSVAEAVTAMDQGTAEVEGGVVRAHEAGQALSNILQAVQQVNTQMEEIAGATEQMSASSSELIGATNNVSAVVEENTAAAEEMAAQVEEVTASAQSLSAMANELILLVAEFKLSDNYNTVQLIELSKQAHLRWKDLLKDMLAGKVILRESELQAHTDCLLGKWYYGHGQADLGTLPEFAALEEPHIHIHKVVREAVTAYNRGDHRTAAAGLDEVKRLSQEIVHLLDRLQQRGGGGVMQPIEPAQLRRSAPQLETVPKNTARVS
ncbi:MAG: methyl-accepting chemotaxis protein, partial [Chloroflexota bacterium]